MKIYKAFFITLVLLLLDALLVTGPFFLLEEYTDLDDESFLQLAELIPLASLVISYLVVFKFFKLKNNNSNLLQKINFLKPEILLSLVIVAIGLHWLERPFFDYQKIIDSYLHVEAAPYYPPQLSWLFSYNIFMVLLIAPILEELLFRKFIFSHLLRKHSLPVSAVISSLCFALIHLPNYRNLFPTFFFGIIACLIYNKTRNILYPVILHFLSNFLWVILVLFGEQYYGWIYKLNFDFTYWAIFIFGIMLTWLGLKRILLKEKRFVSYKK